MARLISWLLVSTSPHQRRWLLLGLLVGEFGLLAVFFAFAGWPQAALYALSAGLVVLFVGSWRIRLLHSK